MVSARPRRRRPARTRESGEYEIPGSGVHLWQLPPGGVVTLLADGAAVRPAGGVLGAGIWGSFRLLQGALGVLDPPSQQPGFPRLHDSGPEQVDRPVAVAGCQLRLRQRDLPGGDVARVTELLAEF